ncbi:aminopeptidase P family protein [Candidatus Nucleicultrix amoebiphila]|jgi:Xaa-Pro aminopeptidase|uniref:X-Pro aminopeptidase n=1 Tax=Candidatus Nucleicultrix amoebiphila FS5 TaxID=1414854 RepID=A0A1W6N4M2_9PROT|nr:aminopeptidase P family protein [Candidatus Nucleicultrix amoebiphila]ARN84804.1 X-Pro aminopeptidase [Candidatus Nucleicultrix amoebiphila FS5]
MAGKNAQQKLVNLRKYLKNQGVSGYILPNTDEHLSEYLPPHSERLTWLTNFRGSAGIGIILENQAALFVDGRYILQARHQTDGKLYTSFLINDKTPIQWLKEKIKKGEKIAYDPWTLTEKEILNFESALQEKGASLKALKQNPIDAIWMDRPKFPNFKIIPHPKKYSGIDKDVKIKDLVKTLKQHTIDAYATSILENVAWLLNIRGNDLESLPVTISHLIVHQSGIVDFFVDEKKLSASIKAHLGSKVRLHSYSKFLSELEKLGKKKSVICIDPDMSPAILIHTIENAGGKVIRKFDPLLLPKACKNPTEIQGARDAHIRDGAALSSFLAWFSEQAPKGKLDEIKAADKLFDFRLKQKNFKSYSFPTISSTGPNGAIIHYRVTPETNRPIKKGDIYLVDSGAQYLEGTTDVTRTVIVGNKATQEQKDRFTRVLKGHIALALAKFPKGTTGSQLDALARYPLWQAGIDYNHGTGHGVGSYLGVHEGPQRIATVPNRIPLEAGMILSNEPGYYKEGAFGIRIENLVVVKAAGKIKGAEKEMFEFETLTLAPIDLNLVDIKLLGPAEKAWLNAYHKRVRETLTPLVDSKTKAWLKKVTKVL